MDYIKHVLAAALSCAMLASCSVSQTQRSKPIEWPSLTPTSPTGVSIKKGRFQSLEGRFTINIPELPFQTLDFGSETAQAKKIDVGKQYAWKFEETIYTIMYSPPSDPDGNSLPHVFEDMVSGSRKGALRSNAKLVSEKSFTIGEFRGTELRYVSAEGVNYINRLFIVGDLGYQVVGGYVDGNEQEVIDVLNSFKSIDVKR